MPLRLAGFSVRQVANYLPDRDHIYAGPMFLCLSKATWELLGRPSLMSSGTFDVGMRLSGTAKELGVPVDLIWPSFVCCPKWPLSDKGCFGIGTFYAGEVFHLFDSRSNKAWCYAFNEVADCVIARRRIDYVGLHAHMNSWRMRLANRRARWRQQLKRMLKRRSTVRTSILDS